MFLDGFHLIKIDNSLLELSFADAKLSHLGINRQLANVLDLLFRQLHIAILSI